MMRQNAAAGAPLVDPASGASLSSGSAAARLLPATRLERHRGDPARLISRRGT